MRIAAVCLLCALGLLLVVLVAVPLLTAFLLFDAAEALT